MGAGVYEWASDVDNGNDFTASAEPKSATSRKVFYALLWGDLCHCHTKKINLIRRWMNEVRPVVVSIQPEANNSVGE